MHLGPSCLFSSLAGFNKTNLWPGGSPDSWECSAATFHVTPPWWDAWVGRYPPGRAVLSPFLVQSSHVIYSHAKNEQVLFPGFLCHFHVGPIHGPDSQGPIQHELHIACPWGFGACSRNLLRQIGGWNDCTGRRVKMSDSVPLDLQIL